MKLPTKPLMCALACAALGAFIPGTAFAVDPGVNQPGAAGNVHPEAGRDPGINQPGAAGNVHRDPGINQPGAVGNREGVRR